MCRYGFHDYKDHFACFECRKAFKKPRVSDWAARRGLASTHRRLIHSSPEREALYTTAPAFATREEMCAEHHKDVSTCPGCGKPMASMGLDFRAPRQTAVEQWEILAFLYEQGFAFHGCGCGSGYTPPRKWTGVKKFLVENTRNSSQGETLLARILEKKTRAGKA